MFMVPINGWTSLMIVVSFLGGIQLLTLGIIGEYISRINEEVRNRPVYVVDEKSLDAAPKK
jgi:dolichol-phosphate mannosyltransferase